MTNPAADAGEPVAVHYRLRPERPAAHLFRVTCRVEEPDAAGQVLRMPAWIPGSYMIRDFARNVVRIAARDARGEVAVDKLDKQTWRCAPASGALTVECDVYAWDLSVRAAHLDRTHGFFNGTSVFLCPDGQDGRPCTLEIEPPADPACDGWHVATSLPVEAVDEHGFGRYRAADYDELIDHPVEMGRFRRIDYEAGGVPHALVLTGRCRADAERLARDLATLCAWHVDFFGGSPPPFDRYLFLTMVTGDGYGGLEHRASSSLMCARRNLPAPDATGVSEDYRTFLGLCSHEYFHSWNVKRIRPAGFTPYRLEAESHTRLLWVFEGFTSYYDDLALLRAGLVGCDDYLEVLGQTVTRVQRGAGRHLQSVAESSFDAWTRFYKQDENAPNAIVSYYTKGALVALCLDLHIRSVSGGEHSLDDVMRRLWREYGQPGRGVGEDEMPAIIQRATGVDCAAVLDAWVDGTDDLPLADLLDAHGVHLGLRAADGLSDRGGKPAASGARPGRRLVPGFQLQADGQLARVSVVHIDSPAERAGIAAGDLLVALDGVRVPVDGLDAFLDQCREGERIACHVLRHDALLELEMTLEDADVSTAWLEIHDETRAHRWLCPGKGG